VYVSRIAAVIAVGLTVMTTFCPVSFAEDQSQALIEAAKQGDLKQVQELLEKGADINSKDNSGWTALMWVSDNGNAEIAKVLLAGGADINAIWLSALLQSPLHLVVGRIQSPSSNASSGYRLYYHCLLN
jgi:ankyrin repeat protein